MALTFTKKSQISLLDEPTGLDNIQLYPCTKNGTKLYNLKSLLCSNPLEEQHWLEWTVKVEQSIDEGMPVGLVVKNPQRKWELVSGYQKSVRRGNTRLAVRLVGAMHSMSTEHKYMARRIGTVVAEDIGAGSPLLTKFVLACFSVFTPTTLDDCETRGLWAELTRMMCNAKKSRLYCTMSITQDFAKSERVYKTHAHNSKIVEVALMDTRESHLIDEAQARWLTSGNWRAEGMAVGSIWHAHLPEEYQSLQLIAQDMTATKMMAGLPNYAYDKHTRYGGKAIGDLRYLESSKELFKDIKPLDTRDVLGWAVFFEEGCLLDSAYENLNLQAFEQTMIAEHHGLKLEEWMAVREHARKLVADGSLDDSRWEALKGKY